MFCKVEKQCGKLVRSVWHVIIFSCSCLNQISQTFRWQFSHHNTCPVPPPSVQPCDWFYQFCRNQHYHCYLLPNYDSALPFNADIQTRREEVNEELTEADLDKIVNIQLSETDTIWLIDMRGVCVSMETDEAASVTERNKKYDEVNCLYPILWRGKKIFI